MVPVPWIPTISDNVFVIKDGLRTAMVVVPLTSTSALASPILVQEILPSDASILPAVSDVGLVLRVTRVTGSFATMSTSVSTETTEAAAVILRWLVTILEGQGPVVRVQMGIKETAKHVRFRVPATLPMEAAILWLFASQMGLPASSNVFVVKGSRGTGMVPWAVNPGPVADLNSYPNPMKDKLPCLLAHQDPVRMAGLVFLWPTALCVSVLPVRMEKMAESAKVEYTYGIHDERFYILGFTGFMCQTQVDNCANRPCLNGGTCTNGIGTYSCQCSAEFTG